MADWAQHRREKRKPITETSAQKLLRRFVEWGETRSIAAINHTIAMGWEGIREPDQRDTQCVEDDRPRMQPKLRKAVAS